jgi:outer membrane protein OmpA-like peptidoglycan-associated protein
LGKSHWALFTIQVNTLLEFFMVSQEDDSTGLVMGVIFGVIALVISLIIGVTIYQKNKTIKTAATATAPAASAAIAGSADTSAAASASATGTTQAKSDAAMDAAARAAAGAAAVVVENGVVKFFFASGKSELPEGGPQALADIITAAKAGKKAIVSGYVDSTGNAAQNKELGKQRAFAVRDLLKASGVADDKIELKKPEDIQAGTGAAARRVEVTLQ